MGHEWAYEEGNRLAARLGAKVHVRDYKYLHIDWKGLMVEPSTADYGQRFED